jgi:hypothetical protein
MTRMSLAILLCAALASGCATVSPSTGCRSVPGSTLWTRTELYFGMQKPDDSFTTNEEYQQFIDKEVTPRFRDGFTVLEGRGQYLGPSGRLWREPTKILVLMYPPDPSKSAAVDEIRGAYKTAFHQEAVMRIDGTTCATLSTPSS